MYIKKKFEKIVTLTLHLIVKIYWFDHSYLPRVKSSYDHNFDIVMSLNVVNDIVCVF